MLRKATVRSEGAGMHAAERSRPASAAAAQPSRAMHTASRRRSDQARGRRPADNASSSNAQVEWEPPPPWTRSAPLTGAGDADDASRLEPRTVAARGRRTLVSIHSEAAVGTASVIIPPEGLAGLHAAGGVSDGTGDGEDCRPARVYEAFVHVWLNKAALQRSRAAPPRR